MGTEMASQNWVNFKLVELLLVVYVRVPSESNNVSITCHEFVATSIALGFIIFHFWEKSITQQGLFLWGREPWLLTIGLKHPSAWANWLWKSRIPNHLVLTFTFIHITCKFHQQIYPATVTCESLVSREFSRIILQFHLSISRYLNFTFTSRKQWNQKTFHFSFL